MVRIQRHRHFRLARQVVKRGRGGEDPLNQRLWHAMVHDIGEPGLAIGLGESLSHLFRRASRQRRCVQNRDFCKLCHVAARCFKSDDGAQGYMPCIALKTRR